MRVQCVICDQIENIPDDSPTAKRLRNRPIHTYMCKTCRDRIEQKTKDRIKTGNFEFRKPNQQENNW